MLNKSSSSKALMEFLWIHNFIIYNFQGRIPCVLPHTHNIIETPIKHRHTSIVSKLS